MYVNLYPNKDLKKTKRVLLWGGVFFLCGGLYVLLSELIAQEEIRWAWAAAAVLISAAGTSGVAVGTGYFHFKDAFFSMTPERIKYRLTLYGPERTIFWDTIDSIQASEHVLVFELKDSNQVIMRLGHIQDPQLANHVSVSIQLAAIEQKVEVNQTATYLQHVGL
ncbi:hypothetical protein [uncultured Pontibacter sp.]|uniref:hypothetical protein n=1 Tax=uncultured Pontibacter sp. TaxID=453356 RepID=UPI00260AA70B|nr:hypothetical protein [uncultured Pontibacter sp.]